MFDFVLQATLSNLLVSTALALVAWIVQKRYQAATLANLLWFLVLIKMLTPPLFSVPLLEMQSIAATNVAIPVVPEPVDLLGEDLLFMPSAGELTPEIPSSLVTAGSRCEPIQKEAHTYSLLLWLQILWCLVSTILFIASLTRIIRFRMLLRQNLYDACPKVLQVANQMALKMGLRHLPALQLSQANVPPFVWWMGGALQIVLPRNAVEELTNDDLAFVLAHEMAHIKRRDHWVRWVEWLATILLWWNPVLWWSRRQLRVTEEIACDAMVVQAFNSQSHEYANSLLNMAETLATAALRPPAVASAINGGGILEKRLTMIIAKKNLCLSAPLRMVIAAIALCVFPIGLVEAQDEEAVERRLKKAVEAEELTIDQAKAMIQAMRRVSGQKPRKDKRDNWDGMKTEREARYSKLVEEIEAAVAAEKLSKEDAKRKMKQLREDIFGDESSSDREKNEPKKRKLEEAKSKYIELAREIEAAVAAEKLSKKDAKRKLNQLRDKMFGDESSSDREKNVPKKRKLEEAKSKYMELAREIEAAVAAEELSKKDAKRKLNQLRDEMFEDKSSNDREKNKPKKRKLEEAKAKYMELAREIEAAVAAEELSKKDAKRKLNQLREKMLGDKSSNDRGKNESKKRKLEEAKAKYMELAREIEAAVAAEKLSKKDAKRKLNQLREEMLGGESSNNRGKNESKKRKLEETKAKYMELAREIEAAVAAEELSKKDAKRKLNQLSEKMFEDESGDDIRRKKDLNDRKLEETKAKYLEISREYDAAVAAEKLSKEKAERKLNELRKKTNGDQD